MNLQEASVQSTSLELLGAGGAVQDASGPTEARDALDGTLPSSRLLRDPHDLCHLRPLLHVHCAPRNHGLQVAQPRILALNGTIAPNLGHPGRDCCLSGRMSSLVGPENLEIDSVPSGHPF